MDAISEFFEPINGLDLWITNFIIVSIISYAIVWLFAVILCRVRWTTGDDNQLRVYFAWLIPFSIHMLLCGIILINTTLYFKQMDISLGYPFCFIILIIINIIFINALNDKINQRIKKLEKRIN